MCRLLALLLTIAIGCDDPDVDLPRAQGGGATDPRLVLGGTIVYAGPRPFCRDGRVAGRVVLILFDSARPPPPRGDASEPVDLFALPGSALFSPGDCLPELPTDDEAAQTIMRTAPFLWPSVNLGAAPAVYEMRALFDRDADFIPFFSIANGPTAGDVVGALFRTTAPIGLEGLPAPSASDAPGGVRIDALAVTIGAPVQTERPIFRIDQGAQLDARATIPLVPDPLAFEQQLFDLAPLTLSLYDAGDERLRAAFEATGLAFDLTDVAYAFYIRAVDANGDAEADPHPVLGESFPWRAPIIALRRRRTPLEIAARVPEVALIGSVRPTQVAGRVVRKPIVEALVPPIAIVSLVPGRPECRVIYAAPGNAADVYERGVAECDVLPTGDYAISLVSGIAGAVPVEAPDTSDTGVDLVGGVFAGQAWTLPNELADPNQLGDRALPEQGATFVLADAQYGEPSGRRAGEPACSDAPSPEGVRAIRYESVPSDCCSAIRHLCDRPLCPAQERDPFGVAGAPTGLTNGVPDCVPFPMPVSCCP